MVAVSSPGNMIVSMTNYALVQQVRDVPRHVLTQVIVGRFHDYELDELRHLLVAAAQRSTAENAGDLIGEFVAAQRGRVVLTPARCVECRGRGWSERGARMGHPMCRSCRGSRRGQPRTVNLRALPSPAADI